MSAITSYLAPIGQALLPIAIAILTPLLVALIVKAFQKMGFDIEKTNRDALQQAITKGALEAVRVAGGPGLATRVSDVALRAGVDQVIAAVPDAIKTFSMAPAEIGRRVEAQAVAIVQATPAPAPIAPDAILGRILAGAGPAG